MSHVQYAVFLAYHMADKPIVEQLARRLTQAGIAPWFDAWHLSGGDPIQESYETALRDCAACAVFIGPHGTES